MISRDVLPEFKKKFDVVSCFIEHGDEVLFLHRHDDKPQGNTWGMPAGKVDEAEDLAIALSREVREELGIEISPDAFEYVEGLYVRYPGYDYVYHIYRHRVPEKPELVLNPVEHKDYRWVTPREALKLDLIQDEDFCIKLTYGI